MKSLPQDFLNRLQEQFGPNLAKQIETTFVQRPTTFRVNTLKAKTEETAASLRDLGFRIRKVSWYKDAFILENKSKRELTETDLYKAGTLYIQSLASMVPPLILAPKSGENVLDLTAAPGSKSSQITALMDRKGFLLANDNNKIRFFKLMHNLELLGVKSSEEDKNWQCLLTMEDGAHLSEKYNEYFDKILLDAPCSAEARFVEGEKETYGYWKESKIKEMAYKQRKLLLSVWQSLKPGGILVYSTCTLSPEENEMQINRLLERYDNAKVLPIELSELKKMFPHKEWKKIKFNSEIQKTLRILPTKEIEGFFVAKIQKI